MAASMQPRQVATFSQDHARKVFSDMPEMGQAWGLLYCLDPNGHRWTLLGDHAWVMSMTVAHGKPLSAEQFAAMPPSPTAESEVEMVMTGARLSEWPLEAFRPQWAIKGWPDEWSSSPSQPMALYPWADLQVALREGWPDDADAYDQEGGE
jgi:hypothetical protein